MFKDRAEQLEYQRQWYIRNRFRIKERMRIYSKQNKKNVWNWFQDYKSKLSCLHCSENHPACLHFHHVSSAEKRFNISEAIRRGLRIETILSEIRKCEVLCANCHAKYHWKARSGLGEVMAMSLEESLGGMSKKKPAPGHSQQGSTSHPEEALGGRAKKAVAPAHGPEGSRTTSHEKEALGGMPKKHMSSGPAF